MKRIALYALIVGLSFPFLASLYAGQGTGQTGVSGPGMTQLGSLSNLYEPVAFDHEMHTAIAESCSQCHHQHPSVEALTCGNCHSLKASDFKKSAHGGFLSCRECHDAIDPDEPGKPGLKAAYHRTCFQCHREMGDVGIDPKGCTLKCHAKKERT
jgi:hypothetical protein